jgi:hypothetical protein
MAVNLSPYGGVGAQFLDNSGNVLTGGKIFTYAAGTTTPQVTYTTNAGNIPHPNPIILDAAGRIPSGGEIWLTDGLIYKFILRDANDVLIATYDGITGINSNFVAFTNQQEIQTATAGQTVFNLTTMSYQPGTNSLSVFVDGVNQYGPGAQYAYLETDSDTVTFLSGLHVGAEVKFTTSQLNSSVSQSNAFQVSYTPPFTGSVGTNVGNKLAQTVSVKDFGAVGDGVTDDTIAIQNAINAAATEGKNVFFPAGTYIAVPATLKDWEGTPLGEGQMTCAFIMKSDMCVVGELGSTIKLANNCSTLASPKRLALFFTNEQLSNVCFRGLIMDMNGANNPISPAAPVSYNRYTQAMIHVSGTIGGVAARIDNAIVENCQFLNTAGVTCIGLAQSNIPGVTLGKDWIIKNNLFSNNGLDTNDHSSIYGWAENVLVDGNTFTNPTPFATVGSTGGNVAYEVHGAYTRFTNNYVKNYYQGVWVAGNATSPTKNVIISENTFYTSFYGVAFFRESPLEVEISQVIIENNSFYLDGFVPSVSPLPDLKIAILINTKYAITNVLVANNIGSADTATSTIGTTFFSVNACGIAGQLQDNITLRGNKATGFSNGARVGTTALNGLGYICVQDNDFANLTLPSGGVGDTIGIYSVFTGSPSSIALLSIKGNNIFDTRSPSQTTYGIYLSGLINTLYVANNTYRNTLTSDYIEVGLTVTTRRGLFVNLPFTPVFKTSGGAITLGNGSVIGRVTITDGQSGVQQVTLNATITVGSTTVIPAGNLQMTLPYTSLVSGMQYFGTWRIFDSAPPTFYFGVFEVDGTGVTASFQLNGGTFATTTNPVTIATGDVLAVQLTYIAQG